MANGQNYSLEAEVSIWGKSVHQPISESFRITEQRIKVNNGIKSTGEVEPGHHVAWGLLVRGGRVKLRAPH